MTDSYFLDRFVRREAELRAGDADRERAAERLRAGHAEGRLDLAEFQERLERCYDAKTIGQLSELVRDLPRQADGARRGSLLRPSRWVLTPLVLIFAALIAASALSGHPVFFWFIPLFFFWRFASWRRRRWWWGAERGPGGMI
jgi:Domain of unknown function (DUF1707)